MKRQQQVAIRRVPAGISVIWRRLMAESCILSEQTLQCAATARFQPAAFVHCRKFRPSKLDRSGRPVSANRDRPETKTECLLSSVAAAHCPGCDRPQVNTCEMDRYTLSDPTLANQSPLPSGSNGKRHVFPQGPGARILRIEQRQLGFPRYGKPATTSLAYSCVMHFVQASEE